MGVHWHYAWLLVATLISACLAQNDKNHNVTKRSAGYDDDDYYDSDDYYDDHSDDDDGYGRSRLCNGHGHLSHHEVPTYSFNYFPSSGGSDRYWYPSLRHNYQVYPTHHSSYEPIWRDYGSYLYSNHRDVGYGSARHGRSEGYRYSGRSRRDADSKKSGNYKEKRRKRHGGRRSRSRIVKVFYPVYLQAHRPYYGQSRYWYPSYRHGPSYSHGQYPQFSSQGHYNGQRYQHSYGMGQYRLRSQQYQHYYSQGQYNDQDYGGQRYQHSHSRGQYNDQDYGGQRYQHSHSRGQHNEQGYDGQQYKHSHNQGQHNEQGYDGQRYKHSYNQGQYNGQGYDGQHSYGQGQYNDQGYDGQRYKHSYNQGQYNDQGYDGQHSYGQGHSDQSYGGQQYRHSYSQGQANDQRYKHSYNKGQPGDATVPTNTLGVLPGSYSQGTSYEESYAEH